MQLSNIKPRPILLYQHTDQILLEFDTQEEAAEFIAGYGTESLGNAVLKLAGDGTLKQVLIIKTGGNNHVSGRR